MAWIVATPAHMILHSSGKLSRNMILCQSAITTKYNSYAQNLQVHRLLFIGSWFVLPLILSLLSLVIIIIMFIINIIIMFIISIVVY